ncbi:TetR/AcrR family transcriptional regulator [Mastigocoleus testarum]|uniref:TetR family transcriptional regulator n=1 Tax=Mastigocoleus testarum BC008 TaxID=371196 RepID=A0A0V7ZE34_9CYAN|nr:TetR/AcrR family transcriptional regulator [Mastigocoleus testarum]KST62737.1 TetR family transcriptional regulator [Mastigocoleus testarum BC008]
MARKKEFEREKVLGQAMETFWRYGYEGTSIQDLVQSMGINRGSIYDTFKDKRSLFKAALVHYSDTFVSSMFAALRTPDASKQEIIDLFYELVEKAIIDSQYKGCLITNSVVEIGHHDPEIAAHLTEEIQKVEELLYEALVRAKKKGEIQANKDPRALARHLVCSLKGLRVISKINPEKEVLLDMVDVTLSVLG